MSKSIISNKPECLVCKTTRNLHRHHVFFGSGRRQVSEVYGCWVWLCQRHHNGSNFGVHCDHGFDLALKRMCQQELEKQGLSREQFIKRFGKNYIEHGGKDDDTAPADIEVFGDE